MAEYTDPEWNTWDISLMNANWMERKYIIIMNWDYSFRFVNPKMRDHVIHRGHTLLVHVHVITLRVNQRIELT